MDRLKMDKSYSEMILLPDYSSRLEYLRLNDYNVKSPRTNAMILYKSKVWLQVRHDVIMRDSGFDLGDPQVSINDKIIVHHINPVTDADIEEWRDCLFDPDNLITTSTITHNYIHYGTKPDPYVERVSGDTKLW